MTPSWIHIFVPLFAVWVCVRGQNCSPQRLEQCHRPLSEKFENSGFLVAETRDELIEVCRKLHIRITCVQDFIEECLKHHVAREIIDTQLQGVREFTLEMCRADSSLAEEYLRHAPCLVRAEPKVKHCNVSIKSKPGKPLSSDERLAGCCLYKTTRTPVCLSVTLFNFDNLHGIARNIISSLVCSLDGYERECGTDTNSFIRRGTALLIGPMKEAMCGTVDESYCSSVDGVVGSHTVALVSSAAALWLWWYRR